MAFKKDAVLPLVLPDGRSPVWSGEWPSESCSVVKNGSGNRYKQDPFQGTLPVGIRSSLLLLLAAPQGDLFEETHHNEGKDHQAQAQQDRAVDAFRQAKFHGIEHHIEGSVALRPITLKARADGSHDSWRGEYQRVFESLDELRRHDLPERSRQSFMECRYIGGSHNRPDGHHADALTELAEENHCRSGLSYLTRHGVLDGDSVERQPGADTRP